VPPREVATDNYAGAAIFHIGAPANENVRAFLCIAQGQYLKIATQGPREKISIQNFEEKISELLCARDPHGKSPRTSVASATRPTAST
jgi:hypothetical protein